MMGFPVCKRGIIHPTEAQQRIRVKTGTISMSTGRVSR
jgi:hypothetical protein